jgi:sec-independent protein translocase protein TatA
MLGLSGVKIVIILVVALLIFGPEKLPELGRTFGKMMAEFKKAAADVEEQFRQGMAADETLTSEDGWTGELARSAAPGTGEPAVPKEAGAESGVAGHGGDVGSDDFSYDDDEE